MLQSIRQTAEDARGVGSARASAPVHVLSAGEDATIGNTSVVTDNVAQGEGFFAEVEVQTVAEGQDITVEILANNQKVGERTQTMPTEDEVISPEGSSGGPYSEVFLVEVPWEDIFCTVGSGGKNISARVPQSGASSDVGVTYIETPTNGTQADICGTSDGGDDGGGDDGDDGGDPGAGGSRFVRRIRNLVRNRPAVAYGGAFGFFTLFVLFASI